MTTLDLLSWGATYHYPQLVLNEETGDVLHAGERSWYSLMAMGSQERIQQAKRRVQRWQAYTTRTQTERVEA